ncbi:two-component regulator propeller domain-containing protein [Aquirufa sp. LEPPI-3A]|uniref:hybrid sensor histidine kinase/response regulator transcription factor n=1 Tax=Aquirufa regiilacus TaxID=3024868 RepID=UPI0028DE7C00|nr:two-component regulator propeller domain-containing protein [Aquirufa sp. LEPPI-3A]MDT8886622.1 two-component regulator propeller domain-containing protein [Aquirufa sp. LEPPI-3A]
MKNSFIRFLLLLCLGVPVWGQSIQRFERLSTASGLSQSTIFKIIQDRRGFLWFATADGLNRYDGHSFVIYRHDPGDANTLSGSDISSVVEDQDGNLWVAARSSGLNKVDLKTGKITRFTRGPKGVDFSSLTISSLLSVGKHRLLASVIGVGILVFDTQNNTFLPGESEVINPLVKEVVRLYKHSNGSIWMGTRTGQLISYVGNHSFIPFDFSAKSNASNFRVRSLFEASNGDLLVGTEGNGLFRFNPQNQQFKRVFYQAKDPLSRQNIVSSLVRDAKGNLWIGTDNGIYALQRENFSQPKHIPSNPDPDLGISSFSVMSMFTDSNRNTWIGTWEAGLNISFFQKSRFSVLRYKPNTFQGLLSNKVTSLSAGDDRGVWVGSNVGLSFFNHKLGKVEHMINQAVVNKFNVTTGFDVNLLQAMPDGSVWVSAWGKGLFHFNPPNDLQPFPFRNNEAGMKWTSLFLDQNRLLLGAQAKGLFAFDLATKSFYNPYGDFSSQELKNKNINSILKSSQGQIWVGTTMHGVYIYDPNSRKIQHLVRTNSANSLKYNHITCIKEDRQHRIWVLTNGGGLHLYLGEGKGFRVFTVADGLGSNTLRGMEEDKKGDLWFTTNGGISKMDAKSLAFVNYDEADGLQGKEFIITAHAKNKQGWMFFGGVNGLNYLKSDSLRMRLDVPHVYLTGLKIFNKSVQVGEENSPLTADLPDLKTLVLQPDQSVFSLDYVALEYQRPKNNRYAYFLEGFDKEWNFVGTQRTATYTNLSPGSYIFKVKATNSDGVWGENPVELRIEVLPPWYRTWWAYLLYFLALVAVVYGFMREIQIREAFKTDIRLKEIEKERIRELEQIKTSFFTNISHELRTPLTLIISPIEKYFLKNASIPKEQLGRLQSIHQNAQKLLRLINQLLDLSKIEAGKQHPVIAKHDMISQLVHILQGFESYAQQKQIKLKYEFPVDSLWVYYDSDIIEKCLSNLLSNAFKHTPEDGKIGVELDLEQVFIGTEPHVRQVTLRVLDTGRGISEAHLPHVFDRFYQIPDAVQVVGTGVGLSLCKELIQLHRGDIQVKSKLGEGSAFILNFPVELAAFDPTWVQATVTQKVSVEDLQAVHSIQQEKPILLVVDDHAEMREFIGGIFDSRFQVIYADRGEDGLEKANTYLPDLVITDWMMPGMSGINLCRALRQNAKTNHIPIVILTSKSSQESQIEGMQSGADDFVSKPFNADILEIRVNTLMDAKERLRKNWQKQMIQQEFSEGKLPIFEDAFLLKATQLIIDHLSDPDFDVEDLEKGLDMSKMQLYRKLKNLTSLAGNEFIRSIRLQQAKVLLETGNLNISEVAYQVGFNDPAYFTRAFKKQYGRTPKSFINHEKN